MQKSNGKMVCLKGVYSGPRYSCKRDPVVWEQRTGKRFPHTHGERSGHGAAYRINRFFKAFVKDLYHCKKRIGHGLG